MSDKISIKNEEGHTEGVSGMVHKQKKRGSQITDHRYKNFIFQNHEISKKDTLSNNLFLHCEWLSIWRTCVSKSHKIEW